MKFEIDPFSIVLSADGTWTDRTMGALCMVVGPAAGQLFSNLLFIYNARASERRRVIKFDPLAEAQNYAADSHHANLVEIARWEFISDAELIWYSACIHVANEIL
jgi:hypothetical protein